MKVKLNGYDPYTKTIIHKMILWDHPTKRDNSNGYIKHNQKCTLLEIKGDYALVKRYRKKGWINKYFINNYKIILMDRLEKREKR